MAEQKKDEKAQGAVSVRRYNSTNLSLAQMGNIANTLGASGLFPGVQDGQSAFVKILAGQEFGIAPFAAMTGIHIISGKATIGANLMAAAVKAKPEYDYEVVKHDATVCEIDFYAVEGKTRRKVGTSTFTIDDAKAAGTKNLEKYPKNMLFARAMSNGVKWYTPDVFGGSTVYTPEEFGADGTPDDDETIEVETPKAAQDAQPEPEPEEGEVVAEQQEIAGVKYKAKIFAQLRDFGFEGDIAKLIIYEAVGIKSVSTELTVAKAEKLIELLTTTTRLKLDQFVIRTGIDKRLNEIEAEKAKEAAAKKEAENLTTEEVVEATGGEVVEENDPLWDDLDRDNGGEE